LKKISRSASGSAAKNRSRESVQGEPIRAALSASLGNAAPANRGAQQPPIVKATQNAPLIDLRGYQLEVFIDRKTGIVILHWSRQIGKSFTLGAWAVDRLLTQLQKYPTWLITVLSNSRDNGAEFVLKCAEACKLMGMAQASLEQERAQEIGDANVFVEEDQSPDLEYQNMRMEIRITIGGRVGRIKVLAANPRTARGFSGDLILDEFAFHEDSNAIWEAAEPILSANPEFLCRIASTGNGKYNMFYRMVNSGQFKVSRVSRTDAWRQGVKIYDPNTRAAITPEQARAKALDKRAYDQNYELAFNDENTSLLTHELIDAAERSPIIIDEQHWSSATLEILLGCQGDLFVGNDIGRHRDLSVAWVLEQQGSHLRTVGLLRMSGMRMPAQQEQLDRVCRLPKFRRYAGDLTGMGVGLVEYLQEEHGDYRIKGVNFSTTEPVSDRMRSDGTKRETARVTEIMATDLLSAFEDRAVDIPIDPDLREDLRKPEKIVSPGGRVSIAAVRDEAGHADHFWALALAIRAAKPSGVAFSAALI
jgi:phage FluMu gp28-like protein